MKVLVVGSGAREHAIAWRLAASPRVEEVFVAPGNAGTESVATNLHASADDLDAIASHAEDHAIDVTVVGPEGPLDHGIVDLFNQRGLSIFGPTKAAARIETSKAFARELMSAHGIPSPDFRVFGDHGEARAFVEAHRGGLVIKADGLASGKGVLVCRTREEALEAIHECLVQRAFGSAGDTVVVEQLLEGREVSAFAFCDGDQLSSLVAACDYKRALDRDEGPNTGGMGSYSPPECWDADMARRVHEEIMVPTVRALGEQGAHYQGVLYAGLMVTEAGPKVLEFNCRLGDPEAQVILPRLETDMVDVVMACVEGRVAKLPIRWSDDACVGVVMASGGYPGEYATGLPISGLSEVDPDVTVFHSGTVTITEGGRSSGVATAGGRVLTVVGRGPTLSEARRKAYDNVNRVQFSGVHYRRDIALLRETAVA